MSHITKHAARYSRTQSFLIVTAAYLSALPVAFGTYYLLPELAIIWKMLAADLAATLVVWGFSFGFKNTSIYDPYWSVIPPLVVLPLAFVPELEASALRVVLINSAVWFWGIRLTLNWGRAWAGLHTEDWRYLSFVPKTKNWYWLMSLLSFHTFPTLTVFVGLVPCFPALLNWPGSDHYNALHWLDFVAFAVAITGVLFELIADEQMHRHRTAPHRDASVPFTGGLWGVSRHPNYFGETTFWLGIGLFGVAADPGAYWWCLGGYGVMLALFMGYSIPAMEQKSLDKRPSYTAVQRRVSMLFPWPPRRG